MTMPATMTSVKNAPITIAAEEPGTVVLDGTGHASILQCGQASFVHLQGLVFEHANGPIQSAAVELSAGWVMADCACVSSVASLAGAFSAVVLAFCLPGPRGYAYCMVAVLVLLFWTHRGNLVRLFKRAERTF